MVIDPVCGMKINEESASDNAVYKGQPYYFCSAQCHAKFQENPLQFVKKPGLHDDEN